MTKEWTPDDILTMAKGYQAACVLTAAADLDVFRILGDDAMSGDDFARRLGVDRRGAAILLDALVALKVLDKRDGRYSNDPCVSRLLVDGQPGNVLAMVRHHGNCMRRWTQLAAVVRDGRPADRQPSIRGEEADQAAFIIAMDNICAPIAGALIAELPPLEFDHVLDVGGGSGTWTLAFLRARPAVQATLFDLPHVIPLADQRINAAGLRDRVRLVAGDFLADPLPDGADLAWVSAIVHQNSREQNRRLFTAVAAALPPGGRILIRDILMDESRTAPPSGALFAVNMLVATEGGTSYTFDELREDLEATGFADAAILRRDEWMNSILHATKAP